MSDLIDRIERRLKSANSTPVERAHITAEEWVQIANSLRENLAVQSELTAAKAENEAVRLANLDVMNHYEDARHEADKLRGRVAYLESKCERFNRMAWLAIGNAHSFADKTLAAIYEETRDFQNPRTQADKLKAGGGDE